MKGACGTVEGDEECGAPAEGETDEGLLVCRTCGQAMEREGFRITWGAPPAPAGQGSLFGGGS